MYFYSRKHLIFKFLKDFSDKDEWTYQDKQYVLDEPSCYYKGSPCYIIFKNEPISAKMEYNEAENRLIENGYSPSDIKAKLNSAYLQRIHNFKKTIFVKYIISVVLWSIVLVLGTVLICQGLWA